MIPFLIWQIKPFWLLPETAHNHISKYPTLKALLVKIGGRLRLIERKSRFFPLTYTVIHKGIQIWLSIDKLPFYKNDYEKIIKQRTVASQQYERNVHRWYE